MNVHMYMLPQQFNLLRHLALYIIVIALKAAVHVYSGDILLYMYIVVTFYCTCIQWCGNSQSCRIVSDKSPVN